jgi:hypothetical protein
MRKHVAVLAVAGAMLVPTTALATNPGSDQASPCGSYHGQFAFPAHGAFYPEVPNNARSGLYQDGTVGDFNSDPACRS